MFWNNPVRLSGLEQEPLRPFVIRISVIKNGDFLTNKATLRSPWILVCVCVCVCVCVGGLGRYSDVNCIKPTSDNVPLRVGVNKAMNFMFMVPCISDLYQ